MHIKALNEFLYRLSQGYAPHIAAERAGFEQPHDIAWPANLTVKLDDTTSKMDETTGYRPREMADVVALEETIAIGEALVESLQDIPGVQRETEPLAGQGGESGGAGASASWDEPAPAPDTTSTAVASGE